MKINVCQQFEELVCKSINQPTNQPTDQILPFVLIFCNKSSHLYLYSAFNNKNCVKATAQYQNRNFFELKAFHYWIQWCHRPAQFSLNSICAITDFAEFNIFNMFIFFSARGGRPADGGHKQVDTCSYLSFWPFIKIQIFVYFSMLFFL